MGMGCKSVICALVFIHAVIVNSSKFSKIDSIQGNVEFIEFDGNYRPNIYVGSNYPSGAAIYKLNFQKDVIVKDELDQLKHIQKIFISRFNNTYIFDAINSVGSDGGHVFFLGHNESHIERIHEFPLSEGQPHVYFMDKSDGQIYFNTAFGVTVLETREYEKRGSTVTKPVDNLENFTITSDYAYAISKASPYVGYIYLGGTVKGEVGPKIGVIKSDEKKKLVPSAEVKNAPSSNLHVLSGVSTASEEGLPLIVFSGEHGRIYIQKNIQVPDNYGHSTTKTIFEPIFGKHLHYFANIYVTKKKFYFFARNLFTGDCYLNYVKVSYPTDALYYQRSYTYWFSSMSNLNFLDYECERANFTSDSKGNIFFTMGKKKVFSLRNKETEIKEIIFPSNGPECEIISLLTDENDSLWILAGDLFMVPKDSLEAQKLTNSSFATQSGIMKIHPKTKEIFIGSENGLYVYSDY